jgi:hypothetical protein
MPEICLVSNPLLLTVRVYRPLIARNTISKSPVPVLTVDLSMPVASLRTFTVAPDTTDPLGSVTLPRILAV